MILKSGNSASAAAGESTPTAPQPLSRGSRRFLWIFSIAMVVTAGSAFVMKLIEFLYEFSHSANVVDAGADSRPRLIFAISPLMTYLIVATGFACLFLWAYFSGQFKDVEAVKHRMLELNDQISAAEARHNSDGNGPAI